MRIAIPIFDGLTALDAVGPYEVLSRLPGAEVTLVALEKGAKRTDQGALALIADATLAEVSAPDVIVVPGGPGTRKLLESPLVAWIRAVHETTIFTTSVCTGSLLLGAAGLLEGRRATAHWLEREQLRAYGAIPTAERIVEEGRIITSAGVSAGIDMCLRLAARIAGDPVAQAIQLSIEYDPEPPFDCGTPEKAPPSVVKLLRERAAARMAERR
jgi:putative intracellular protease/amidase